MGKTACKGRSIPMDKLDQLVTRHIADRLLVPDRITALLAEIVQKRAAADGEVQDRIDQLSRQVAATEEKLRRLYALVEDGITDLDDVLKARLTDLKADRDLARSALDRINNQSRRTLIDPPKIERFGSLMRENSSRFCTQMALPRGPNYFFGRRFAHSLNILKLLASEHVERFVERFDAIVFAGAAHDLLSTGDCTFRG